MPSIRDPRLSPMIKMYLTFLVARNHSPNTVRAYRRDLAELAEFAGARARVARIDHIGVRSFLVRLQGAGTCRNSVYRKLAVIKSFYRWVDNEGLRYDARILTLSSPRPRDQ